MTEHEPAVLAMARLNLAVSEAWLGFARAFIRLPKALGLPVHLKPSIAENVMRARKRVAELEAEFGPDAERSGDA